jgi:hypothetical protein
MRCQTQNLWGTGQRGIAFGHEFKSYCLVIRPLRQPESVESLMFALQNCLCQVLELENSDIGVSPLPSRRCRS